MTTARRLWRDINLTLRMGLRRLMRSNNGHSKKREHHDRMTALYMMYYNFIRSHMTLTARAGGVPTTPMMEADIIERPYSFREFLKLSDGLTKPKPRGPYKVPYRPRKTATNTGLKRLSPAKVSAARTTGKGEVVRIVPHVFAT